MVRPKDAQVIVGGRSTFCGLAIVEAFLIVALAPYIDVRMLRIYAGKESRTTSSVDDTKRNKSGTKVGYMAVGGDQANATLHSSTHM